MSSKEVFHHPTSTHPSTNFQAYFLACIYSLVHDFPYSIPCFVLALSWSIAAGEMGKVLRVNEKFAVLGGRQEGEGVGGDEVVEPVGFAGG